MHDGAEAFFIEKLASPQTFFGGSHETNRKHHPLLYPFPLPHEQMGNHWSNPAKV